MCDFVLKTSRGIGDEYVDRGDACVRPGYRPLCGGGGCFCGCFTRFSTAPDTSVAWLQEHPPLQVLPDYKSSPEYKSSLVRSGNMIFSITRVAWLLE